MSALVGILQDLLRLLLRGTLIGVTVILVILGVRLRKELVKAFLSHINLLDSGRELSQFRQLSSLHYRIVTYVSLPILRCQIVLPVLVGVLLIELDHVTVLTVLFVSEYLLVLPLSVHLRRLPTLSDELAMLFRTLIYWHFMERWAIRQMGMESGLDVFGWGVLLCLVFIHI